MTLMERRRALMGAKRSGGRLPANYQEVEWIGTNTINGYLITNIPTSANGFLRAVFDCSLAGAQFCFGNAIGSNYKGFNVYKDAVRKSFKSYPSEKVICPLAVVLDLSVVLNNGTATGTANGEQFSLSYNVGDSNPYSIFRCNAFLSHATAGKFRLIKLSFESDGGEKYNFIPCYRKNDGEIGLFDTENSMFYTNAGTETFTKGADVN